MLYRLRGPGQQTSDRLATRLMLAGIGLAFLPGMLFEVLPGMLGFFSSTTFGLSLAQLAIPILPFFYVYAIYKRQLGVLEFRTNRLIGLYSFILLYPPIFLVLVLSGNTWLPSPGDRTVYLLVVSTAFVIATPPLLSRFQSWLNRLAYGTAYDPEELVHLFANQLSMRLDRHALVTLIQDELLPSLLIRQSQLVLLGGDDHLQPLYSHHVDPAAAAYDPAQLTMLREGAGFYRSPDLEPAAPLSWVRLAILLKTRDEVKGIWLFGKRDPDDFYPQPDVDLLQTLANQLAPAIENIQLYEALQRHADNLTAEVALRTAELRAEKDRTQAVLDSAGEGIFFTDPQGVILYVNPFMTRLTGYAADALLGRRLDYWLSDTSAAEMVAALWTAVSQGKNWVGNLVLQHCDGALHDVNLTLAPIQTGGAGLQGFVGVQSDISKFKEVDRLKSNIIANVSHELRTPLTNIRMYLDLLKRGNPEKQERYFKVLNYETERLTRLIQDLLDLSKLDSGELATHLEPLDLWMTAWNVFMSSQAEAERKEIDLLAEEPGNLPLVFADEAQLVQVLTNLVTNAINYTQPEGRIWIRAGSGRFGDAPGVWIAISDNGPGIAPRDLPHLFDRFYRGESSRGSDVPGTGLGLAICKEIIDRHEGAIEVRSVPGEGTTFTVWLRTAVSG
ncbi:MAG: PAS domain S-box protein [Anaerolineales bacterium]|nr:PAS domain S-box protein [Anaerolineales bacterium]